jgi:PAS domain S-box-containing protein
MKTPIRVLIIEDSEDDKELLLRELARGGYNPEYECLETGEALNKALDKQSWDIILSDYAMPKFDGPTALKMVKARGLDIPFILISGTIGEDIAVAAMKSGAQDYIMKGKMARLVPAIERELKEAEVRRQRKLADEKLIQSQRDLQEYFEDDISAVYVISAEGQILNCNKTFVSLFGFENQAQTENFNITQLFKNPHDRTELIRRIKENGRVENYLVDFISKDGKTINSIINSIGKFDESGELVSSRGYIVDITQLIKAEEEIKANESKLKSLVEILQYESVTIQEFLDHVLEEAIKLTKSKIGYIYHYSEENKEFTLNSWSKEVMKECTIQQKQTIYQLHKTGIWGEAVRQRKTILVNDFRATHPLKKGYPNGHVHLNNFLTVPVFYQSKIVGIVAVANKETNYSEIDVLQLTLMMNSVWKVLERRKAEETLRISETKLRAIFSAMNDVILVLDKNGRYLEIAPSNPSLLYKPSDELIGKTIHDVFSKKQADFFLDHINQCLDMQQLVTLDYTLEIENKTIWFSANLTPLSSDTILLVSHDITERKQTEREITMLGHALKSINQCVSITDLKDKIIFVNHAFLETYGFNERELIGENITMVRSSNNPPDVVSEILPYTLLGVWKGELINKRKDGSEFPIALSTTIIKGKDGIPLGLIGVAADITKRKDAEQKLILALEKAQESDRLKSAFLANMSHEIRTPMNGILGFSELLKEPGLSGEEQQEYVKIIEKSGVRMLNIINDIVDISKIEAGLVTANFRDVNINGKIEFMYQFFKPEIEGKGIQLFFKNGLPNETAIIHTDEEKLYAILINLVKNATKYTDSGFIEIGYNLVKEDLSAPLIAFYVKDSGIGIPKDRQKAIFERFIQADISDSRAYQGAGLGLSISKAYVEMLGGTIWVESEIDKGSTFYFTIPYDTESNEKIVETQDLPCEVKKVHDNNLCILIVDDDDISRSYLALISKKFSKNVLFAENGKEAVELVRNTIDLDLILMDIKMPVMNGYEATFQIRQFNKEVIIIAQTAFGLEGDRKKSIEAGCNDHISKPIRRDELTGLMQKYFKK